jgi:hypothetical protein
MGRPGWLKLWRSLQQSKVWQIKPFSHGQAWVDLLMRANFSESTIKDPVKMADIPIRPGQIVCSLRQLAVDWGWSRNKLARYLGWLQNDATIEATHGATYTIINVLNWKEYQGDESIDGATNGATNGATRDTRLGPPSEPVSEPVSDTIRRSKEEEEGKNVKKAIPEAVALAMAKGKAKLFEKEISQHKVLEYIGYLENQKTIPAGRILDWVNTIWNLRESMVMNDGVPTDRLLCYAIDQAIEHKAERPSYIGKVMQNAVIKWREGALKF